MKKTISLLMILALTTAVEVASADFTFGTPTNLGPIVNTSSIDAGPSVSADGLSLYFSSDRTGGYGGQDLWITTRETINDPWSEPVNLGPTVNSSDSEAHPDISANDRELYFRSPKPGGFGGHDLWVTTRATVSDPWEPPVNLGSPVNTSSRDSIPNISADGLSLFFASNRPGGLGGYDLWVTTRATTDDPWEEPVNLGSTVNSSHWEEEPCISADGLALFFSSERPPGEYLIGDIWVATRPTTNDEWGEPVNLGPNVNTSYVDTAPDISADGSILYFHSDRPGGSGSRDLWQVSIELVVDLNGDGIVDSADVCIMVDHWGTDEPLCDIGPMPWGDGIVDVQDLVVLAEHLLTYPGAVAYWKLDETEGFIAYDSVGVYDGVLNGDPTWQPTGGAVDGALEFDGIDDYVSADFVLNPDERAFSVFAWVKGSAPGQVVISQTGGVDWLLADPSQGKLMTSLSRPAGGRFPPPSLVSEFVITDGDWHRVGFVWDGSDRILYADDVQVARDTQLGLGSSEGGLYIGAGSTLKPGGFFSGLIDDVRIYDRAVIP